MKRLESSESRNFRMSPIGWYRLIGILCFLVGILGSAFIERHATPAAEGVKALIYPSVAFVRTPGTWRLSCVIQADSMAVGGGVKMRFVKGVNTMQNSDPNSPNYVSARTSNPRATVAIRSISQTDTLVSWDWDRNAWVVTVLVQNGALYKGDTIHVDFGANPPKGRLAISPAAYVDSALVAYDLSGSGIYHEIRLRPTLEILPHPPYRLASYLPSTIPLGMPATLNIVVLDDYNNLATSFSGTIALAATDSVAVFPRTVELTPSDSGHKTLKVWFKTPGVHYFQLAAPEKGPDSLWQVRTNPSEISSEVPPYRIFWGDLHSHSRYSHDGHGTGGFLKARDVACLDFYALTDHTTNDFKTHGGLTTQEWETIKREVIRYHKPGKFVTFPAYEFSANPPSGHHNIFFNAPDALIPDIPLLRDDAYSQVQKVWMLKETLVPPQIDMITIPHHSGIIWNINTGKGPFVSFGEAFSNPTFRPLIEIYSIHGLSEYYDPEHALSYKKLDPTRIHDCANGPYYAQDAWAAGEFLGVIASSDDHSSNPGQPYNGLAAVYATELTRDAIFDALKNRHTYGTTGQRIILQFAIDGYLMGSNIRLERGKYPKISVEVYGTDDLDFVEVLRWDNRPRPRENGHPLFQAIRLKNGHGLQFRDDFVDSTYAGSSIYYVRVKQKRDIYDSTNRLYRQVWAWSSPIWVQEAQTLDTVKGEPVPRQLLLRQSYPNPFDRSTLFTYYLPRDGKVEATLYNVLGQRVHLLVHDFQTVGWHNLRLSSLGLTRGVYFVRLQAAGQMAIRKVILMK